MRTFLRTFARDRAIDADELALISQLADLDRVVDDDERAILDRIFRRIRRDMVPPDVWHDMQRFKRRVGV
jgi:hypothetical protein